MRKERLFKEKKIFPEKSFILNLPKKIYFSEIWKKEMEKSGDDEIISYYRDDEKGKGDDDLMDFPLALK